MKKLALACLVFLSSNIALASGKLSFKPQVNDETGKTKYSLGLAVYEKIAKPLAYKGWIGGGNAAELTSEDWLKTEQGVEFYAGPLAVGVGLNYTYFPDSDSDDLNYYGSVSVSLW